MSRWRWNVVQYSTRRGSMSLPIQAQSQLYHFKSRILALVAAQVFRVVMVSRLFGISRKTFYKYRHQATQGRLASCDCTPRVHGSAKPQHIIGGVSNVAIDRNNTLQIKARDAVISTFETLPSCGSCGTSAMQRARSATYGPAGAAAGTGAGPWTSSCSSY